MGKNVVLWKLSQHNFIMSASSYESFDKICEVTNSSLLVLCKRNMNQ